MNIDDIPDDALMPMRWVRQFYVPKVTAGAIPGAYQSSGRSPWFVPRHEAAAFLDAFREDLTAARRRRARRPWKGPNPK